MPAGEPAKRLEAWVWGPAIPRPAEPLSFCPEQLSEQQLRGGHFRWEGEPHYCLSHTHSTSWRSVPMVQDAANSSAQRHKTAAFPWAWVGPALLPTTPSLLSVVTAVLRDISHQTVHPVKCTIQWFPVYSQSSAAITKSIFIAPGRNPVSISSPSSLAPICARPWRPAALCGSRSAHSGHLVHTALKGSGSRLSGFFPSASSFQSPCFKLAILLV